MFSSSSLALPKMQFAKFIFHQVAVFSNNYYQYAFFQRRIAIIDTQIYNLVYELYDLTEEEIEIVEQNQLFSERYRINFFKSFSSIFKVLLK